MDRDIRLKRLNYRASHRGTREADYLIGGFCAAHCERWNEDEIAWFESFLEEQDVDIMAWALGTTEVPAEWQSPVMSAFQKLDFVDLPDPR